MTPLRAPAIGPSSRWASSRTTSCQGSNGTVEVDVAPGDSEGDRETAWALAVAGEIPPLRRGLQVCGVPAHIAGDPLVAVDHRK
jgi:hypothetical protein